MPADTPYASRFKDKIQSERRALIHVQAVDIHKLESLVSRGLYRASEAHSPDYAASQPNYQAEGHRKTQPAFSHVIELHGFCHHMYVKPRLGL